MIVYCSGSQAGHFGMATHGNSPDGRPYNNLLRRLSAADFALIAPHLADEEAAAGDLLYSPGDHVEIVHFPCGPSLASFLVPNEDGRDVETILVGREGAVGGIVSEGYLPAYTRIMVKFGGPFSWPRSSSRRPAMRSIRSNSAPPNGSSRRWSVPMMTRRCR
jgi:hypothetical protein